MGGMACRLAREYRAAAGPSVPCRIGRLRPNHHVEMLDGIMAVAVENRPRFRPLSRQARELSDARICYDHLAGRLSVDIADFFTAHEYIVLNVPGRCVRGIACSACRLRLIYRAPELGSRLFSSPRVSGSGVRSGTPQQSEALERRAGEAG